MRGGMAMELYGHQFYRYSLKKRVEVINEMLKVGKYQSFETLMDEIRVDAEGMIHEMRQGGYYFVQDLNKFIFVEMGEGGMKLPPLYYL
jgi:hypothetical protein